MTVTIDYLIESTKETIPRLKTKQEREKQRFFVGWLVKLRNEVGGDVMVSETAARAAVALTTPAGYAEHLREKGAA